MGTNTTRQDKSRKGKSSQEKRREDKTILVLTQNHNYSNSQSLHSCSETQSLYNLTFPLSR